MDFFINDVDCPMSSPPPLPDDAFDFPQKTYEEVCDRCRMWTKIFWCRGCFEAKYCSKKCQKEAWPKHKLRCKI